MTRRLELALIVAVLAIAAAAVGCAGFAFWLWPTAKRIDSASHTLLDCTWYDAKIGKWRGNGNCLPSAINAITGAVKKSAGAVATAAPEISSSMKQSAAESVNASKELTALAKQGRSTLAEAEALFHDLRGAKFVLDEVQQSIAHVNAITLPNVDAALRPLGGDLEKLGILLDDLHRQIAAGGPVDKIVGDLDLAVQSLNARLADPHIAEAIGHLNGGSANLERLIGYVADAFAPTKQSFWKALGLKLIPLGLGHLIPQKVSLTGEPVQTREVQP